MTSPPGSDLEPFASLAKDLQNITEALAAASTEREVIEIVLTPAVKALGAVAGIVLLVDRTDQQLKIVGSQGYEDGTPTVWQEGRIEDHVLIADILRMKEPRYFEYAGALKEAYPELESRTGGLAAIANATLPMFLDEHPFGVIVLDFTEPHHFTEVERRFLTILASQCAVALGRAEVRRTLEERVEERTRQLALQNTELQARTQALEGFAELTRDLALTTDPLLLIGRAQEVVMSLLADGAALYYEPQGDRWFNRSQHGSLHSPDLQATVDAGLPLNETRNLVIPWTTGQPYFQDVYDQDTDDLAALTEHIGTTATLPLRVAGTPIGVLAFVLFDQRAWTNVDRVVLGTVVHSLELALDRAQQTRTVVTQRDALEARTRELEASNEELEAFTYSVSHDLRTPVRHIISFEDLLRRSLPEVLDARTERYFGIIAKAAVTLNTLIDGMLEVSRASRQPLKVEPVDLNRIFKTVMHEVEINQPQRHIDWQLRSLPTVMGDVSLLRQVITALVDNAVKYTRDRERAVIEVWAEDRGQSWAVLVRDNGVGFNPQYAGKLFTMFQRLHRQEDFEGAAVSLANARRIVTRHGGTMLAEGQPGVGATFGFILPRAPG